MVLSMFEDVVVRYYTVWSTICQMLTYPDLCMLSSTSTVLRSVVCSRIKKIRNIDGKLSRFVSDATSFRLMLRDTGAVIAGEFARCFFIGHGMPNELDVVMVDPRFYSGVKWKRWRRYLRRREDYMGCFMKGPFWKRGAMVSGKRS